ncbi:DUF3276 family protein [Candidatus Curtissbacteria bacterium]|nr:DUF3276 family protein [Candidatus Curtissbacteria bacterium]
MDTKDSSKNTIKSVNFRIGNKTFFFDVKIASNDGKYLKVTESRFMGEGEDRVRNSVVLFPKEIKDFQENLKNIIGYLN